MAVVAAVTIVEAVTIWQEIALILQIQRLKHSVAPNIVVEEGMEQQEVAAMEVAEVMVVEAKEADKCLAMNVD